MAERSIGVSVSITRYISDDPQPGIVACEFSDIHGPRWEFIEKTAIVAFHDLSAGMTYPQPGVIGCEIVSRHPDGAGRGVILIDTGKPWGVETIEGRTRFEVWPESLVEWEWGQHKVRAWNG